VSTGAATVGDSGQSDVEQWRNQACCIAIIELRLSEGISQSVSQSAEKSVK